MKKYTHIVLKVIVSLILLITILGVFGVFPEPTADMYNSEQSFAFITALSVASYIMYTMGIVFIIALFALWTRREALAALLILPITINIIGFHLFLDGGLFLAGAMMGNILLLINLYLLWKYRTHYRSLLTPAK